MILINVHGEILHRIVQQSAMSNSRWLLRNEFGNYSMGEKFPE